jgi:hypothetical protein
MKMMILVIIDYLMEPNPIFVAREGCRRLH